MTRLALKITSLFIFFMTSLSAQNKNYEKEWLIIEELEVEGKVTSALEKVNALHIEAIRQKNNQQQLKTLLFRWKFKQIIDEKSQVSILEELNAEIKKQEFPKKQLLHMYMAYFLETYLNDNYWNINQRTVTENAEIRNYQTWDQNTFLNQISSHYEKALNPYLALANIPTKEISELLVAVPISRKYKPTLYDIIVHKALNFYTNSRSRFNKPKDEFLIDSEVYFTTSANFSKQQITTTDKESLLYKAISAYQQLEIIHSQRKNNTAWTTNVLERLQFVKSNFTGSNTNQIYLKSLQQLTLEFKNTKEVSLVEIELAKTYRSLALTKDEKGNYKYPDYNKIALELITKIEALKVERQILIEAKNLKNQILQNQLTLVTQDKFLPNKPHLAKATFTNAKKFIVNAYQVPTDFNTNNFNYKNKDSLTEAYLAKQKLHFSKSYSLPIKKDYNSYSIEFTVPKLPLGSYILRVQTDTLTNSYKYQKIQVTELSLNKTDENSKNEYQVLNRYTGTPISNAKVEVRTSIDHRNNEYKTSIYKTNTLGEFTLNKESQYEQKTIIVKTENDALITSDYLYRRGRGFNYEKELNLYKSKTLLFLDRAIYRPKQTVYFKAIAISEKAQKSRIIANQSVTINAYNPNNEKVLTKILTTNEYGSVHGEFKLPEDGLNGQFRISASLDTPKNKNKNSNALVSFSVEEYKRPTFEVSFSPVTEVYKPLDSIKIKGNAKAFLGSNVTDATVIYSVKRTTQYRNWWYYSRQNNESKQIAIGEVITNETGDFTISFKAKTDETDTKDKIYNYSIKVKVIDLNGETQENTTTIKVADKNLLASINTSKAWNSEEAPKLNISIADINGNPIKGNGEVTIYKLESPKRFLNARPWPVPDIQNISESDFKTHFPHLPFTNENDTKNWKKEKQLFSKKFNHQNEAKIEITNLKKWPAGKYSIITKVTDPKTKTTTETKKAITLAHENQKTPTDGTIFVHNVNYDANNPKKATIELQTAVPQLIVFAEAFDGNRSIWKEKIIVKQGSKTIPLQLAELTYPKVTVHYKYQVFNYFYTAIDVLDFEKTPTILSINKKHFTDKISPGAKKTWSFLLKSSDEKAFNAEALASMYDASLDQFRKSNWDTNFNFSKSFPNPNQANEMNRLGIASINFRENMQPLSYPIIPNEQLEFFGFDFNKINSRAYSNYINTLKYKIDVLKQSLNNKTSFVKGVIYNQGEQLPFVNINIKNTKNGTSSDLSGEFIINAKKGDTLIFNLIGFKTQEFIIKDRKKPIFIDLKISNQSLEELLIIGYGSQKKSELTGSLTAMKSKRSARYNNASEPMISKPAEANTEEVYEELEIASSNFADSEESEFDTESQKSPQSKKIDDLKNIAARKNLQETAFFLPNLHTNKKGEIEFEFNAPEALTRWNFRMLAHTKEATSGNLTAQTLTQKELSITPNAPRFVREGDQLRFTAKIANLTAKKLDGTALLEWTDPTTGNIINQELKQASQTQPFCIDANGNSLLSWTIEIPKDITAIQYKIVAKAKNFSDGEEKIIPVLSNRMLVTESIPLWVRAGETETYSLANFDVESKTQKPHNITVEYTSNPAWMAIKSLPYLMEFPHECSEQVFSRLYANTMAAHILNSQPKIKAVFESWQANETLQSPLEKNEELKSILIVESPWLQEAKSETEQQKRLAELFDLAKTAKAQTKAINKLRQLQKSNGGFPWFSGGYANSYITRHVVAGFGHLEKLGVIEQRIKTDNIVKNAIHFLDKELVNDFDEYLKYNKTADGFYKQVSLLHFAYVRSFYLDRFPLNGEVKTIINKALSFQKTTWQLRSIYEKGLLALVLHRFEKSPMTQKILTALTESAVNSKENGMYWKENTSSWWWYQNPISTQALLIETYAETKQPKKYIEEMKIFLLKNKRTNRWETTIETANASYALLLNGNNWLSVKDNTTIEVGGTKIATKKLAETKQEQGTGYFKTSWKADEITLKFKEIKISNKSKVTGYGGYYWQYFENLDNIKTDDNNPLSIDKELYKKVITNKGTELKKITPETPLKIGDKVTVRLLIKSNNNMEFVHLKDMRASGFEPTKVLSGYEYKDGLGYYQSTKDVATHFFVDNLQKGNYVLEYDVIANQVGSFSNGITSLQCMYAPEFSSHSAGQRVDIRE